MSYFIIRTKLCMKHQSISARIVNFVSKVLTHANTTKWKSLNSWSWPWHFEPYARSPLGASLNQPVFEYYRVFNWIAWLSERFFRIPPYLNIWASRVLSLLQCWNMTHTHQCIWGQADLKFEIVIKIETVQLHYLL